MNTGLPKGRFKFLKHSLSPILIVLIRTTMDQKDALRLAASAKCVWQPVLKVPKPAKPLKTSSIHYCSGLTENIQDRPSPFRCFRSVPRLGEVVLPGNLLETHILRPDLALQQPASWGWAQ